MQREAGGCQRVGRNQHSSRSPERAPHRVPRHSVVHQPHKRLVGSQPAGSSKLQLTFLDSQLRRDIRLVAAHFLDETLGLLPADECLEFDA